MKRLTQGLVAIVLLMTPFAVSAQTLTGAQVLAVIAP